ncbi:hypothetical protein TrVE_jg2990 [Triparma verrucosa]|uniref:Uncharacterized protein n=1 Tax=Triparma verrucosa TaxID=1606542 RepID=A0A9W7FFL4_9STRA|nr:hypothetical protein TrVE_jg2990 [Triparma verrucosa]
MCETTTNSSSYSSVKVEVVDDEAEQQLDETTTEADTNTPPAPSFHAFISLSRNEWPMLGVALLFMTAAEVAGLTAPLLLSDCYDYIVDPAITKEGMRSEVSTKMGLVFLIHWGGMFCGFIRGSIIGMAGERVVARLREDLYSHILLQEIGFFDAIKSGDLVSRLGSDTGIIQVATTSSLPEVTIGIIKSIACVVIMFLISPKLAVICLGVFFGLIVFCIPVGVYIGEISKLYQDALAKASSASTEALGSIRTVKSFVAEKTENDRYTDMIGRPDAWKYWWPKEKSTTYRHGSEKSIVTAAFGTVAFGIAISAMYATLWVGFNDVIDEELSLGKMVAFQSYVFNIGLAVATIGGHVVSLFSAKGAAARVFELLDRNPSDALIAAEGDGVVPKDGFQGSIEFKSVQFAYPSRLDVPVLDSFSMKLNANESVALVGSSGAGKSTIISLLLRFYEVTAGEIIIDDNNIKDLSPKFLRGLVGLVAQEPVLFGLSILDNVRYGNPSASVEEVHAVCKSANCFDFINTFPDGFDTLIGERGIKLSGGQKQRIAIARALLLDPKVLLLDEATSALDSESEHLVQTAIDQVSRDRSTIIIAHRLSTVKKANKIIVISDGKVLDEGTHEQLMKKSAKYQELVKLQLSK